MRIPPTVWQAMKKIGREVGTILATVVVEKVIERIREWHKRRSKK